MKGTEKVGNLIELNTFILIIETAGKAQFRRLLKMIESVICIVSYPLLPATEEQEEPTPWRDLAINSNV